MSFVFKRLCMILGLCFLGLACTDNSDSGAQGAGQSRMDMGLGGDGAPRPFLWCVPCPVLFCECRTFTE